MRIDTDEPEINWVQVALVSATALGVGLIYTVGTGGAVVVGIRWATAWLELQWRPDDLSTAARWAIGTGWIVITLPLWMHWLFGGPAIPVLWDRVSGRSGSLAEAMLKWSRQRREGRR